MFEVSKVLFEIIFIVCGYHVYKTFWKLKLIQNCSVYLSQIIVKMIKPKCSFNCFEAAGTASLTALVVAESSASDNGSLGL